MWHCWLRIWLQWLGPLQRCEFDPWPCTVGKGYGIAATVLLGWDSISGSRTFIYYGTAIKKNCNGHPTLLITALNINHFFECSPKTTFKSFPTLESSAFLKRVYTINNIKTNYGLTSPAMVTNLNTHMHTHKHSCIHHL